VKNFKELKHLEKVEFDYVQTPEEMKIINSINRELIDLKFTTLVGIKVMSTIIKQESLERVLRRGHKISRFFLTIEDIDGFKRDISIMGNCIKHFRYLESFVV